MVILNLKAGFLLLMVPQLIVSTSTLEGSNSEKEIGSLIVSITKDDILEKDVSNITSQNQASQNCSSQGKYIPTWESLDSRPLPGWYDEAKVGIFIHWGVWSVPSYKEWFWYQWVHKEPSVVAFMKNNYPPNFTYQDFAKEFTTEFFDPDYWADTFSKAGARYIVLTSKHCEGFTLWPSKYSFSWNAMDVGPKRDLVGELANSIRKTTNITFGLYYSLYEWFNPLWLSDQESGFTKHEFSTHKAMPELRDLVSTYKPELLWSDGNAKATSEYWQSKEFLTWLYNESPVKDTVVTNDRWGNDTQCAHGGFYTCNDHYNPGKLQPKKWENCLTLDKKSWGYRRIATLINYLTIEKVIEELVQTVAFGGNYLINIGPTKEGTLPTIMEERLLQMGTWLQINGEAIYSSVVWNTTQIDSLTKTTYYTSNKNSDKIFAILLDWPGEQAVLGSVNFDEIESIDILGGIPGDIHWTKRDEGGVHVAMPRMENVLSNWAWTLAISLKN